MRKRTSFNGEFYSKKDRKEDPSYYIWRRAREQNNSGRQLIYTIRPEDIVVPSHCPILGIKLKFHYGYRGHFPDTPSIDRIDNTKGYVPGNVQVISSKANTMKSNANKEELLKFAFWIYKTYMKKEEN